MHRQGITRSLPIELPPAISPDQRTLALARRDGGISIVDLETGKERRRVAKQVRSRPPAFAPAGDRLAFGLPGKRQLYVWDHTTDQQTCEFTLPDEVLDVAWNRRVEEWQVAAPLGRRWARHRFSLDTIPGAWMEGPRSIDISPDGRLLATADLDGLRIFSGHIVLI